jgi:hypothetical protein
MPALPGAGRRWQADRSGARGVHVSVSGERQPASLTAIAHAIPELARDLGNADAPGPSDGARTK